MIGRLSLILRAAARQIWVRAGLYGLGAIATVALAGWAGPMLPAGAASSVNINTVRDLLEIMASSMLLVATFSLGAMVAAFTAAATIATPRASTILIDDPVAQNVLATFVGAFVFSIIALVALTMGYYGDAGRVLLLIATSVVVLVVIATLFGWFDYLANMVRLGEIMNKVERRARDALERSAAAPCLGGRRLESLPEGARPVAHDEIGYVASIDIAALDRVARKAAGEVYVLRPTGHMVEPSQPPVWTSWPVDPAERDAIRAAVSIGPERTFDHDPRYCLIVLSEIASRALSPGLNDFGTAIETITRLQRLLIEWSAAAGAGASAPQTCDCPQVLIKPLEPDDLIDDAFGPLARDGAGFVEVGLRLQKALASLAAIGDEGFAAAVRRQSERALEYARAELTLESDRDRVEQAAAEVRAAAEGRRAPA
ncbi:MAG: DUF2254 domain-containing protein [Rhodobacteraceae bacterium]|nr:DUF2254 domain-containing protein [Paracoccaceae bacterium]